MSIASISGRVLVACLLFTLPLAAQDTDAGKGKEGAKQDSSDKKKEKSPKEKLEARLKKQRKFTHELEMARLELQVSEISVVIKQRGAEASVSKADRSLDLAKGALTAFETETAPMDVEQAKIRLERSRHGADHAKDELAELKAMYKADEFAEMTKELVLKRGERRLQLARRSLAVEEGRLKHLLTSAHPRKVKELRGKVEDAMHAVEKANLEHKKTSIEVRISRSKATFKVDELGRDLRKVRTELEEAAQKKT